MASSHLQTAGRCVNIHCTPSITPRQCASSNARSLNHTSRLRGVAVTGSTIINSRFSHSSIHCSSNKQGLNPQAGPQPAFFQTPSSCRASHTSRNNYINSSSKSTSPPSVAPSHPTTAHTFRPHTRSTSHQHQQPTPGFSAPPSAANYVTVSEGSRRGFLLSGLGVSTPALAGWGGGLAALLAPAPASASRLPAFADRAWEAMGGGPADLFFPDSFLGVWDVASTLVKVETPLGMQALPDKRVVERAKKEDLNQTLKYQVQFVRNRSGRVVYDRAFNTAALVSTYYDGTIDFSRRITWDVNDPNVLVLEMPRGNLSARTRITRRSQEEPSVGRIETSEFVEQVFDTPTSNTPKVKASQCFTKMLWREPEVAAAKGGPTIVATQVVSDYLTSFDGEEAFLKANGAPVAVYTYKVAFLPAAAKAAPPAAAVASAAGNSTAPQGSSSIANVGGGSGGVSDLAMSKSDSLLELWDAAVDVSAAAYAP